MPTPTKAQFDSALERLLNAEHAYREARAARARLDERYRVEAEPLDRELRCAERLLEDAKREAHEVICSLSFGTRRPEAAAA